MRSSNDRGADDNISNYTQKADGNVKAELKDSETNWQLQVKLSCITF